MFWKLHLRYLTLRTIIGLILSLLILSIFLLNYICPDVTRHSVELFYSPKNYDSLYVANYIIKNFIHKSKYSAEFLPYFTSASKIENAISFENMLNNDTLKFNIKANDLLVFLHIQKTGGTSLGHHLVRNLNLEAPCKCKKERKRCKCIRPNSKVSIWLFSRYTTGWRCGVHADWTELVNCVNRFMDQNEKNSSKRRYFYLTLLREPVSRFLSEFRHIQRGATWKKSIHLCKGRVPTKEELPSCYTGANWINVTLEEFTSCPHNLAFNRQTRMLADLSLVDCYNKSSMNTQTRDRILLESAKHNLKEMAYFGICEYQKISQYLFESSFKLHFLHPFIQLNETHSSLFINEIDPKMILKIQELNYLDIILYDYAKKLLFTRFEKMKQIDKEFDYNYHHLGLAYNSSSIADEVSPEMRIMRKVKKLKEEKLKKQKALTLNKSGLLSQQ